MTAASNSASPSRRLWLEQLAAQEGMLHLDPLDRAEALAFRRQILPPGGSTVEERHPSFTASELPSPYQLSRLLREEHMRTDEVRQPLQRFLQRRQGRINRYQFDILQLLAARLEITLRLIQPTSSEKQALRHEAVEMLAALTTSLPALRRSNTCPKALLPPLWSLFRPQIRINDGLSTAWLQIDSILRLIECCLADVSPDDTAHFAGNVEEPSVWEHLHWHAGEIAARTLRAPPPLKPLGLLLCHQHACNLYAVIVAELACGLVDQLDFRARANPAGHSASTSTLS